MLVSMFYDVIVLIVLVALAACLLIPDEWTVKDCASKDTVIFRATCKAAAKRKAKAIMRRKGWAGFRLKHPV